MEPDKVAEAQGSLRQLFLDMEVKRVVFIDDEFRLSFERVSGVFAVADPEELKKIDVLQSVTFTDDKEINLVNFRKLWDTLNDSQKYRLFSLLPKAVVKAEQTKIEEKSPTNSSLDYMVIPILHDVFEGIHDIDFKELSFTEWKSNISRLLDDAKTIKTIFFFDQDLTKDGGSEIEGVKQIQYTLDKADTQKSQVICGLLSHTFTPEQAYDNWKTFAKENNINESQFILVAKSEINDPPSLVHMIKLMMLNGPCNELIFGVSKAIEDSYLKAKQQIEKVNIFNFDHIVFRSSHREGVWEIDTLTRLFGLFQRDIIRDSVRTDVGINKLLSRIRNISNIKSSPPNSYRGNSWQIQRSELYENGDHLNRLHLPLELGDIFLNSDETKKYILIAQPCDLMIRLEGDFPGNRRPSVYVATIAEIVPDKPNNPNYYWELPLFIDKTSWFASFISSHTINLLVLDLCVFQDDGTSKFIADQECPNNVIPAWQLHHEKIKRDFTKNIEIFLKLKARIDNGQLIDFLFKSSIDRVFKATIDYSAKGKETINYDCKRVGRLCEPRASAMLTAYANYVCRAAFEHDFGELPQSS